MLFQLQGLCGVEWDGNIIIMLSRQGVVLFMHYFSVFTCVRGKLRMIIFRTAGNLAENRSVNVMI